ncbi:hypothetical protein FIBSPDRAFT_887455 [Athelia psychrophila]|uniref:Uncharacterized protein n=1 Tax=Athelia psychrophila TaxID=1759441 RepID=A0A166PRI4_9AGAM|nr:hypothetical protein FIBSPDRAFT_887455 [Fibularhizoctonia sp. CBS 109695]
MSHQGPRHSYRQELHNYLQAIYRNSSVLEIPVQHVGGGVWRADVFIYGDLIAQATAMSAADAREAAAARALVQHRGCNSSNGGGRSRWWHRNFQYLLYASLKGKLDHCTRLIGIGAVTCSAIRPRKIYVWSGAKGIN